VVVSAQTTYLTVAEVAACLHLSEVSVRRKIRDGTIPAVRLSRRGRGALRVPEHKLEDWLERLEADGVR
jgi:excisionase family DNA binding protein